MRSRGKGEESAAGLIIRQSEQDDSPRGRSRSNKKRRPPSRPAVSVFQICAGCTLTIALLIFALSVDFQSDKKKRVPSPFVPTTSLRSSSSSSQQKKSAPALNRQVLPDGSSCRYDGQCGVSKTCAVSVGGEGGRCEPFASQGRDQSVASRSCFDACLQELQIDEHWYHETWPVVDWSEDILSQGRPNGCMIVYHREPQGDRFNYLNEQDRERKDGGIDGLPPSLIDWVNARFRHIKRVDPLKQDISDNRWVALCTAPCLSDADCATRNDGSIQGFVCREHACLRNPLFWGPEVPTQETSRETMEAAADMVLVTGATGGYLPGLTNLAASARYWAPQYKMVVYNLGGMSAQDIAKIRSWSNVIAVEWENGIPDRYPPHVHEGKVYAWKPIIVNETVHKYGSIFWLDSGSTLAGPVQPVQTALQHQGIVLMKGQDLDMRPKASEKSFEWFGHDKRTMAVGPHFSGNTQAFMYPSRYIDTVVIPNCKCALDVNCIAPAGSGLGNHRYDQTTISILAYRPKTRLPHYTEFLAASSDQLKSDLSQPSFKFVWTARQGSNFYADHDPELHGNPPNGGYFHFLPDA